MAVFMHFLATSASQKRLSIKEIEELSLNLLHAHHVSLPVVIYVGEARNFPRGEDSLIYRKDVDEGKIRPFPENYIIPNAPEIIRYHFSDHDFPQKLCLYYGDDEQQFLKTLQQINLDETDLCISFEQLSPALSDLGWAGAVIYALRQPLPNSFKSPWGSGANPLVPFDIASFFTLYSDYIGGEFEDLEHNILKDILKEYYGPDLIMVQG